MWINFSWMTFMLKSIGIEPDKFANNLVQHKETIDTKTIKIPKTFWKNRKVTEISDQTAALKRATPYPSPQQLSPGHNIGVTPINWLNYEILAVYLILWIQNNINSQINQSLKREGEKCKKESGTLTQIACFFRKLHINGTETRKIMNLIASNNSVLRGKCRCAFIY